MSSHLVSNLEHKIYIKDTYYLQLILSETEGPLPLQGFLVASCSKFPT